MNITISIIIPTKERNDIFEKSLMYVLNAVSKYSYEIIVVNDSKTSCPKIPENNGNIKIIDNPKSGVASARNYGAGIAKGDWLLFLDDDMLIFEENIKTYLNYTNRTERFCANIEWDYPPELIDKIKTTAFGRFLIRYGFTTMRGWNGNPAWENKSIIAFHSITSQNLFIRKNHFFETKGYDENFPFAGAEDYVFSKHLNESGFIMYIDTTTLMYHNEEDRVKMKYWLKRKERGGTTMKIAVKQGFLDFEIKHNLIKKLFYISAPLTEPLIKFFVFITSSSKYFDFISFKLYKILLGISTNKGYRKNN